TDGLGNLGGSLRKGMESFTGENRKQDTSGSWNAGGPSQPAGGSSRAAGGPAQPRSAGMNWEESRNAARSRNAGGFLSQSPLFAKTFGTRAGGVALLAIGCTIAGGCLIALLVFLIMHLAGVAGTILTAMTGTLIVILIA